MQNLSCENEFHLHENNKSLLRQWLRTFRRFVKWFGAIVKWPIKLSYYSAYIKKYFKRTQFQDKSPVFHELSEDKYTRF